MAGCSGSSLEQTSLPDVPQTAAPATHASQDDAPDTSPDASDAPDDSSSGDADAAPVSGTHAPSTAPSKRASNASASVRYACRQSAPAGYRACDAMLEGTTLAVRDAGNCNRTAPYCASDLQAAYGITQVARSAGRATVAIVDAYGYPDAAGDLAVYRRSMGLPVCTPSSGCLKIVNQHGRANPLPKANGDAGDDWRAEEALDLDVISAICPNCKILLVQANGNKSSDLAAAVNAAAALGAVAISNAYGGKEERADDPAYRHPGRAIVASVGEGAGARVPCAYAAVVCVGGTSLAATPSVRGWSEHIWHGAASGCSALVTKPSWQHQTSCKTRAVPDVAAVADPATGVAVYESAGGGWLQMGGTGVGSSIVAALFALGPGAARTNGPQWIWRHGVSGSYHHLGAGKLGYDGASGWGTPNGAGGF